KGTGGLRPEPPVRAKDREQPAAKAGDGWNTVQRKPRHADDESSWQLRKGDWDAPVIAFDDFAAKLAEHTDGAFRAVVLCKDPQFELLSGMLLGSGKEHGVTAITLQKDGNRCPGKVEGQLRFRNVAFRFIHTHGQDHPKPRISCPTVGVIKAEPTTVLFARFHKQYMEPSAWTAVCKAPQKEMHLWAAKRNIKIHDSFSWAKERRAGDASEVIFGIIRVSESQATAITAHSGERVFLDPSRKSNFPSFVTTWVDPLPKEAPLQYLSRVRATGCDYGIVVGLRWAPVSHRVERQVIKAQGSWSLRRPEPAFTKTETVPVDAAATTSGQTSEEASASPAVVQADAAADGKTKRPQDGQQAAKKQCQAQRALPDSLTVQSIPTDGNCLFGAFSAGLALANGKSALHPTLIRTQVTQHLKKHQSAYEPLWQGELPDTTKSSDFAEYLTAIGREGSWGSSLEIRALARLYDTRIVIFPRQFHFNVAAVHTQQKRRVVVLLHNGSHFDLVKPVKDKEWPQEILDVCAELPPTMRGGGPSSEAGSSLHTVWTAASAHTVWTDGDRLGPLLDGKAGPLMV
ncbi:Otud6a, partial [Symbiodinium sp. KB8]